MPDQNFTVNGEIPTYYTARARVVHPSTYPDIIPNQYCTQYPSTENWNLNSCLHKQILTYYLEYCKNLFINTYVYPAFSLTVPKKIRKLEPGVDTKKLKIILMVPDI